MSDAVLRTPYALYYKVVHISVVSCTQSPCSITSSSHLQVYLVGDPVQLPATVISSRAIEFNYDNSLFKRLQLAGYPVKVIGTRCQAISATP